MTEHAFDPKPGQDNATLTETERELPLALREQGKLLDKLSAVIDNIGKRLEKAMKPMPPEVSSGEKDAEMPSSPLTSIVHLNNRGIKKAIERISSLSSRLEL
jgi:hypothetical protein